jgi:hypothetical protein
VIADKPYQLPVFKVQVLPCLGYMFPPVCRSGVLGILTVSVCGMVDWLVYNGGLVLFRRVNVMCADLVSLIFSRQG